MTDHGDGVLSDARIAAMSPAKRRDLIQRLERPLELIPWMIYLAFTLPDNYVAHNWPVTWIGFDCVLITTRIATAVLGWLRRELVFW